jgi:predicted aldo/keto reductase-like oxidoreductase
MGPAIASTSNNSFLRRPAAAFGKPVCRLGLASHGATDLAERDIVHALDRGVNFINWAGDEDVFSRTIRDLGARRREIIICVQFSARKAADAALELRSLLSALGTEYVDVLTFYYVEAADEWSELTAPDGALAFCRDGQRQGHVRRLGVTTHQRPLAAPHDRAELDEALKVLEATGPMVNEEYERLAEHGRRVRKHAGNFP